MGPHGVIERADNNDREVALRAVPPIELSEKSATPTESVVRCRLSQPTAPVSWLSRWRYWVENALGVRLGVLRQYPPRALILPDRYTTTLAPGSGASFSIVTPSFNQGRFLERTIQSVLSQGYPNLEYIVQDGKSRDETAGILERYQARLAHCESAEDMGQAQALNRGFRHATGDVLAFLNSDDLLLPGTIHYVAGFLKRRPDVDVVYGHRILVDETDAEIGRWVLPPYDDEVLGWFDYIPQETLFWRRRVWEKVGGAFDESFHFALDWDLLLRFRVAGARFVRLPRFLGAFRVHANQKTSSQWVQLGIPETHRLHERCHGRRISSRERYWHIFPYLCRHVFYEKLYQLGVLRY
jgi:glycosyltransferase involved in cell wall biosynthesis